MYGLFALQRQKMVTEQIQARGIRDSRILQAFLTVPRHHFVPADQIPYAYQDTALPIGFQQTISQPYVVAFMTQAANLSPQHKVLEIGTGSGYQTAILSLLVRAVYSIEVVPELAQRARQTLEALKDDQDLPPDQHLHPVHLFEGNGYEGCPLAAPFDAILVTAAPLEIPPDLLDQLAPQGRLVIPVGDREQMLMVIEKTNTGMRTMATIPVRFVPMTNPPPST
jgi:protein-L-isoaspartate(D-aspartate) O-methyltransferase